MSGKIRFALIVVLTIIVLAGFGYFGIYFRFTHPELTETQVLLARWKEYLVLVLLAIGARILAEH